MSHDLTPRIGKGVYKEEKKKVLRRMEKKDKWSLKRTGHQNRTRGSLNKLRVRNSSKEQNGRGELKTPASCKP